MEYCRLKTNSLKKHHITHTNRVKIWHEIREKVPLTQTEKYLALTPTNCTSRNVISEPDPVLARLS